MLQQDYDRFTLAGKRDYYKQLVTNPARGAIQKVD